MTSDRVVDTDDRDTERGPDDMACRDPGIASGRIEFLDFGRGLAILGIVLYHYTDWMTTGAAAQALSLAGSGVHVFILLSGFGMTLSRFAETPRRFYARRFARVCVPYYLFVTFVFLANQLHAYYPGDGMYAYLGHIFWYKMFDSAIIGSFGEHLWFLSPLLVLYLLFPLLNRALARVGGFRLVLVALLVSSAWWVLVIATDRVADPAYRRFFLQFIWEFCLGMAMGQAYRDRGIEFWRTRVSHVVLAAGAGLAVMAALVEFGGVAGRFLNDVPALVGYTALIVLLYRAGSALFPRVVAVVSALGTMSLELYLVHMFFERVVSAAVGPGLPYLQSAALVVPTLVISIAGGMILRALSRPLSERVTALVAPR